MRINEFKTKEWIEYSHRIALAFKLPPFAPALATCCDAKMKRSRSAVSSRTSANLDMVECSKASFIAHGWFVGDILRKTENRVAAHAISAAWPLASTREHGGLIRSHE